jgi:hypothetical protein
MNFQTTKFLIILADYNRKVHILTHRADKEEVIRKGKIEDNEPTKIIKKTLKEDETLNVVASYSNILQSIENIDKSIRLLRIAMGHSSTRGIVYSALRKLKETRNEMVHNREIFLRNNKSELENYEESVKQYEALINKPDVREEELQTFFERNPRLIDRGIEKLLPQKSLAGEAIPDFIAVLYNGSHILIEIEKSDDQLYTQKGHPSSKFSQAEQQVRDYMQWVSREQDFLRRRGLPDICVENTKGLLIIGMRKNLTAKEIEKLAQQNFSSRSSHEIKTFDDLLEENKQVISSIRSIKKPK